MNLRILKSQVNQGKIFEKSRVGWVKILQFLIICTCTVYSSLNRKISLSFFSSVERGERIFENYSKMYPYHNRQMGMNPHASIVNFGGAAVMNSSRFHQSIQPQMVMAVPVSYWNYSRNFDANIEFYPPRCRDSKILNDASLST